MKSRKRISKAWILTPIAILLLFVFWMFQGVVLKGNSTERAEKEHYDNFFIDYYNNDEGIIFDVLAEADYKELPISQDDVWLKAEEFLDEKGVSIDDFTILVDQGIYSNMSLGVADSFAWRVMFIDNREQNVDELSEDERNQTTDTTVDANEDNFVDSTGEGQTESETTSETDVEDKLSYWIVIDGNTGDILSAYSNGK